MLKAEILENPNITFPRLMISEDNKVVLFRELGKGTIIDSAVESEIGIYSESFNMEMFHDFTQQIVLTNGE